MGELFFEIVRLAVAEIKAVRRAADAGVSRAQAGKDMLDHFQGNKGGTANLGGIFFIFRDQLQNIILHI